MIKHQPTGHVSHMPAGSLILTPRAVELLAKHLAGATSNDLATRAVIDDLRRLARQIPQSRDPYHVFASGALKSELTTREAAARLGVTPSAIRHRINRGQLPATFDGRTWIIQATDLESD